MNHCVNCYQKILDHNLILLLNKQRTLCQDCFHTFNPIFKNFKVDKIPSLALYAYGGIIQEKIFLLKGGGDLALAPIFLEYFLPFLKVYYHGYLIVPAPSHVLDDEARGFNHVQAIFKSLNLPILKLIHKTQNIKQAGRHKEERELISETLEISDGKQLKGKKILLVDDVLTTGATLRACLNLLKKHHPKMIKILVIAKTEQ